MAPGSQEGNFSPGEGQIRDPVPQNVSKTSVSNPVPSVIGRSPTNSIKAAFPYPSFPGQAFPGFWPYGFSFGPVGPQTFILAF